MMSKEKKSAGIPFHKSVRMRPGMYIGRLGSAGFGYLISRLVADFAAEFAAREAYIRVSSSGTVTIKFPYISFPSNLLLPFLKQGLRGTSSSFWSFSLAVIAPLSKSTRIKIGSRWYSCDRNGKLAPTLQADSGKMISRFEITFQPDPKILKACIPDDLLLFPRFLELTQVCPGLKIVYRNDNTKPFTQVVWCNPEGVRVLLRAAKNMFYEAKLETGFSFNENGLRGEAYWLCANGGYSPIHSFANGEATVKGGSHVTGCVQGILDALKDFVKGDGEKYDFNVSRAMEHQCLVVSVWGNNLQYAGSTKECVEHEPTRKIMRKLTHAHMKELCRTNPEDVKQLTLRLRKWNLADMYPELYGKKKT
jgi:DNA gyrase/topoisomerase IV subunit B